MVLHAALQKPCTDTPSWAVSCLQLAGFEAWMRAQEVEEAMGKAGAAGGLAPGAPALSPYGAISTPGMELRTSTSGMARVSDGGLPAVPLLLGSLASKHC